MRFWYDCEFLENGKTIIPISFGMVSEDDRELYLINKVYLENHYVRWPYLWKSEVAATIPWVKDNVLDKIPAEDTKKYGIRWENWGSEIKNFITNGDKFMNRGDVELWGHFSAYDHVVLCQTFGAMIDLPEPIPMFTNDDMTIRNGQASPPRVASVYPEHHALYDAKYQKYQWESWTRGNLKKNK